VPEVPVARPRVGLLTKSASSRPGPVLVAGIWLSLETGSARSIALCKCCLGPSPVWKERVQEWPDHPVEANCGAMTS
jgi:hypothetical protein